MAEIKNFAVQTANLQKYMDALTEQRGRLLEALLASARALALVNGGKVEIIIDSGFGPKASYTISK